MSFSSIRRSGIWSVSQSPTGAVWLPRPRRASEGCRCGARVLAQPLGRQVRDRLVIFGRHESGAGVDVDRRQAVDDGLAQAKDRHVALLERLLVSGELDPAVLEALDDLRAGV